MESSTNIDNSKKKIEKEVGPDEGISTLAIELVNTARSDITAVKGFLTLPSGFQYGIKSFTNKDTNDSSKENINLNNNISTASHNSIVQEGDLFTLFFDVNILNDIKIGQYNSTLKVIYSKVLEKGKITSSIPIQFDIPGKVILDTTLGGNNSSKENQLIPGQYNEISLVIKNKGSAYANGVIATIKGFEKQTNESDSLNNDDSNGNDRLGTTSLSSAYPLISAVNTGNRTFNVGIYTTWLFSRN